MTDKICHRMVQYTVMAYGVLDALGLFRSRPGSLTVWQLFKGGDSWRILDILPPCLSSVYLILDMMDFGNSNHWEETVAKLCPAKFGNRLSTNKPIDGIQLTCSGIDGLVWVWIFRLYFLVMAVQFVYGAFIAAIWVLSGLCASTEEEPGCRSWIKRNKTGLRLPAFLGLFLCLVLTTSLVIGVWIERSCVDTARDNTDDNAWGVGQVLAVLAWLPSTIDILRLVYSIFKKRRGN